MSRSDLHSPGVHKNQEKYQHWISRSTPGYPEPIRRELSLKMLQQKFIRTPSSDEIQPPTPETPKIHIVTADNPKLERRNGEIYKEYERQNSGMFFVNLKSSEYSGQIHTPEKLHKQFERATSNLSVVVAKQPRLSVEGNHMTLYNMPRSSVLIPCPKCKTHVLSYIKYTNSYKTHLCAGALCITLLWPLVWLPYFTGCVRDENHFCPQCETFLGSSSKNPNPKISSTENQK